MQSSEESESNFSPYGSATLQTQAYSTQGLIESQYLLNQQSEDYGVRATAAQNPHTPLDRIEQYIANWLAEESLASSQVVVFGKTAILNIRTHAPMPQVPSIISHLRLTCAESIKPRQHNEQPSCCQ